MAIIIQETNTEGEGDPYYEVKKSQNKFRIFEFLIDILLRFMKILAQK